MDENTETTTTLTSSGDQPGDQSSPETIEPQLVTANLEEMELGPTQAESLARYLYNPNKANRALVPDDLMENFKSSIGFTGRLTIARCAVLWQMLLDLPGQRIIHRPSFKNWLQRASRGEIEGFNPSADQLTAIADLIGESNVSTGENGGKTEDPDTIYVAPGAVLSKFGDHIARFRDRKAKIEAGSHRHQISYKPVTNAFDVFCKAFYVSHSKPYIRGMMHCIRATLQHAHETPEIPAFDIALATAMVINEHNPIGTRNLMRLVFPQTPPGLGWWEQYRGDIENVILGDVLGIHKTHAQTWCAQNRIKWGDFVASAIVEAHKRIAPGLADDAPGKTWPPLPPHVQSTPTVFQDYMKTQTAQDLARANGKPKRAEPLKQPAVIAELTVRRRRRARS